MNDPQNQWWNQTEQPTEQVVIYPRVRCPNCRGTETRVTSTQKPLRYHRCLICDQRFKSVEPA